MNYEDNLGFLTRFRAFILVYLGISMNDQGLILVITVNAVLILYWLVKICHILEGISCSIG
jgi:hypothetical protein